MWWGRWDLNPGSPAPQAGILVQTSRQITAIHGFNLKLDDDPAFSEYNQKIENTLIKMLSEGKHQSTRRNVSNTLRNFNRHVDLMEPEAVKLYIAQLKKENGEPLSESAKQKKATTTIIL